MTERERIISTMSPAEAWRWWSRFGLTELPPVQRGYVREALDELRDEKQKAERVER